ncbi:hypothetical protein HETIRDRAFT_432686 [Heterobasidion irregulare TC 32-1]|uniref:Uncharacterized protein n=1 Tax=Heterobasidion irregulare (strain TC 32-1) TaxID=747525 RepID=W4KLM4_HETIT|nr:uncharacterized protein HETIRDRAFT_432686 [Heterobasidion irregulare TC 32-1]ETW86255.1 hypothetical protein HETIRDRAFT_432686 [Heterobasidion irregulare TC 32-1]
MPWRFACLSSHAASQDCSAELSLAQHLCRYAEVAMTRHGSCMPIRSVGCCTSLTSPGDRQMRYGVQKRWTRPSSRLV